MIVISNRIVDQVKPGDLLLVVVIRPKPFRAEHLFVKKPKLKESIFRIQ